MKLEYNLEGKMENGIVVLSEKTIEHALRFVTDEHQFDGLKP